MNPLLFNSVNKHFDTLRSLLTRGLRFLKDFEAMLSLSLKSLLKLHIEVYCVINVAILQAIFTDKIYRKLKMTPTFAILY